MERARTIEQHPYLHGGEVCHKPVFILGSPRSGTSILAWSLAEHSGLWTSGESDILFHLFGSIDLDHLYTLACGRPHGWFRREHVERVEFLQALGMGIDALFSSRSGSKRWVEQTPTYTLLAEHLADMFPDALFVHILRDGRQVVNSMIHFRHTFKTDDNGQWAGGNFIPTWVDDFRDACQMWREHVDCAMGFMARHPDRCLTVVHEELTANPEEQFAAILRFLDLPHEDGPARYLRDNRINSSFARGQRPDPWASWSEEQKRIFVQKAGNALMDYGLVTEEEMQGLEAETGVSRNGDLLARQSLGDGIRGAVEQVIPRGSSVLVISKGDEELVRLEDRLGHHFPQSKDGVYAGYYPATAEEVIGQVEILRSSGAEFLLIPRTAFWWLEFYSEFARWLNLSHESVLSNDDCLVYRLIGGQRHVSTHLASSGATR